MTRSTALGAALGLLLVPAAAAAGTDTLFLNRCVGSCTFTPGPENSTNNTSSIITGVRTLSPFNHGDPAWQVVVACVQRAFEPFDVVVTDVDPAPASHREVAVAGTPAQLGYPAGTAGVAPFTCGSIPNSISFAFAGVHDDMLALCWTAAQEAAHTYGLDHEVFAPDPMTYLEGCLPKTFAATTEDCGEGPPRDCLCGGTTQNSFDALLAMVGPTPDPARALFRDGFEDDWDCNWSLIEPAPPPPLVARAPRRLVCAVEPPGADRRDPR